MDNTPTVDQNGSPPARKRNTNWIWYFAVLIVLTIAACAFLFFFDMRQPLTPERLEAAVSLWKKNGPSDYDMEYTKQLSATEAEIYRVQVRAGEVTSVELNNAPLEERLRRYHSVPALFKFIEEFQKQDAAPNHPRTFTNVVFDPHDGHLRRNVRSVAGEQGRVEIVVTKFDPVKK
jgi:hypothetical protein